MRIMKYISSLLLICLLLTGCSQVDLQSVQETDNVKAEKNVTQSTGDSPLEVHYIDIGQGDATLIKCGSHAMLVDGGNNYMGTTVQLYLQKQGVESLDYIIGTHPDADHIGGLDVIAYKFDFDTIIMPDYEKDTKTYEELVDVINEKQKQITYPIPGTTYSLGEAGFTILAPISNDYGSNANNYSVAFMLEYGQTRFLFTGDAEEESEQEMLLQSHTGLKADVYKVAHHGSSSASTEAFLSAVQPTYAVISCGEDNSYGHPHAEVLNRLRQMGVEIFRTDEQGSIVAVSDGEKITWDCAPDTDWKAGEPLESDAEADVEEALSVNEAQKAANANEEKEKSSETSYILNTNTKKFHLPECKSTAQIQEKNCQESELGREELIQMGYEPCKNCNP